MINTTGILYGVGVGPGDPMLLTLKAHELIQQADVISYLSNKQGNSQARTIARYSLDQRQQHAKCLIETPIMIPMSTHRDLANKAYDEGAQTLVDYVRQGLQVVFLCEGDPLFFGSFAYLLARLHTQITCRIVPGISSVHASAAALSQPLTVQEQSLVVTSGRQTDDQLRAALMQHDSVVIMKAGRARGRIMRLLKQTQRWQDACYVEYVGRPQERIVTNLDILLDEPTTGPYFSLFVVSAGQSHADASSLLK